MNSPVSDPALAEMEASCRCDIGARIHPTTASSATAASPPSDRLMNVSRFEAPGVAGQPCPNQHPEHGKSNERNDQQDGACCHICRRSHGQNNAWCDNSTNRQTYQQPEYRQDGSGDAAAPTDGEHQGTEGGHQDVELGQPPPTSLTS